MGDMTEQIFRAGEAAIAIHEQDKEMKTSRIKEVVSVKPWKDLFYHNLILENGDKINLGKKKQLEPGWKVTYEIVDTSQEFNKAKPRQEEQREFTGVKQHASSL